MTVDFVLAFVEDPHTMLAIMLVVLCAVMVTRYCSSCTHNILYNIIFW